MSGHRLHGSLPLTVVNFPVVSVLQLHHDIVRCQASKSTINLNHTNVAPFMQWRHYKKTRLLHADRGGAWWLSGKFGA